MFTETLYKQDSTGKVRTYQIEIDGDQYRMITGTEGGKKVESKWTVCTAKNVGRANETTPEDQAIAESEARITKKLASHYYRTREECINNPDQFFQVMLATEKEKVKPPPTYPLIIDPKLDGMRLVELRRDAHSRKGKPIPTAKFISEELEEFFFDNPNMILDGEIYNHAYKEDFNQLMSIARKMKPTQAEFDTAEEILEYHVYDLYNLEFPNMPAIDRKRMLQMILPTSDRIHLVDWQVVHADDELKALNQQHVADGYEGSIARSYMSPYKNGRSKDLMKIKQFITEEYVIDDILEGTGNRSGIAGTVMIWIGSVRVGCGIRGSWDHAKKLLDEKEDLIGQLATIRHFGATPDGSLRFPVCIDVDRPD